LTPFWIFHGVALTFDVNWTWKMSGIVLRRMIVKFNYSLRRSAFPNIINLFWCFFPFHNNRFFSFPRGPFCFQVYYILWLKQKT
jgi:hypothetical protein